MTREKHDELVMEKLGTIISKLDGVNVRLDRLNGKVGMHESYFNWLKGFSALVILVGLFVAYKTLIGG